MHTGFVNQGGSCSHCTEAWGTPNAAGANWHEKHATGMYLEKQKIVLECLQQSHYFHGSIDEQVCQN